MYVCMNIPQAVIRHHLGVEDVNFDLASKIKVGRLCEAFPVLAPSIIENAFLAFRHNFRDCAAALDVAFPGTRALDEEVPVCLSSCLLGALASCLLGFLVFWSSGLVGSLFCCDCCCSCRVSAHSRRSLPLRNWSVLSK